MPDLANLSERELAALSEQLRREVRRRRPIVLVCDRCGEAFAGRADAHYCSTRCRVAAHRDRKKRVSRVGVTSIGYEGKTLEQVVARLQSEGVNAVVDVRLNATSRKRGFSKRLLATTLEEAGIQYFHLRCLGNERDNRSGYAEVGTVRAREARSRYRTSLEGGAASDALAQVVQMSQKRRVALLCFEADEKHCHREQVLEAIGSERRDVVAVAAS